MDSIREAVGRQHAVAAATARLGLAHFLQSILINSTPEPGFFADRADEWQRELLAPMIPAFDHLAGINSSYDGPLQFMHILARGHNKSSLEAWLAAWLLLASRRIIHGYILAADRDQGRLVLQAMEDLLALNPWLAAHLKVTKSRIEGPAGFVEVLPFDAASGMGLRGNLYICDEFVHWKRQKEWTMVVTGLHKVHPTVFVAISNAGLLGSWQHDAFLEALHDRDGVWSVFHREGTLASWLDPDAIARNRRLIPPSEAERLFDNKWIDPAAEHDYLRRHEVQACQDRGVGMGLMYRMRRQVGVSNYVAGVDYGAKRDRTALVVMHLTRDGIVVIDRLDVWQGSPEKPVQVEAVEQWIRDVKTTFQPVVYVLDPHQMEGTIQWMQKHGYPVEAFASRAGQGNFLMAQHLRAMVADRRLVWYEAAGALDVTDKRTGETRTETLVDELSSLRVKKMPYGYRFDHENQKHDDRAVAITMAALRAVDYPATGRTQVHLPQTGINEPPDDRRRL